MEVISDEQIYKLNEADTELRRRVFWESGVLSTCKVIAKAQRDADMEKVREIFKVYDGYVKALEEENGDLVYLAHTHGWRSSRVEEGKKYRSKIKSLKQKYLGGK